MVIGVPRVNCSSLKWKGCKYGNPVISHSTFSQGVCYPPDPETELQRLCCNLQGASLNGTRTGNTTAQDSLLSKKCCLSTSQDSDMKCICVITTGRCIHCVCVAMLRSSQSFSELLQTWKKNQGLQLILVLNVRLRYICTLYTLL
jgi:hypothetical protein